MTYKQYTKVNIRVQYVNILLLAATSVLAADGPEISSRDWASLVGQRFRAERDVVYKQTATGPLKLDLYIPYDKKPGPTVLYIHGGSWRTGSKEQYVLWYLPYLQLGMRVAAVQYRLSGVAPAPAAVEDCRCAFRWVANHGAPYGIDPNRILVTGGSAGGHLALMTAFADESFDGDCREGAAPKARAVINYYGPTDLRPLLDNDKISLRAWLRGPYDVLEMARRLSPLTWIRPGGPPVLTLHGDADELVPFDQAKRLEESLAKAGIEHELVAISGGHHGRHTWSDVDTLRAQRAIETFLQRHQLASLPGPEPIHPQLPRQKKEQ